MQIKNSLVLLTALTAGSAVARLHGHERRHAHGKRQVGAEVYATIDGVLVSWVNEWAGAAAPTSTTSTSTTAPASTSAAPTVTSTPPAPASSSSSASGASQPSSSASNVDWTSAPANGQYSSAGFGGVTSALGVGDTYIGNVGNPWGSNIIEVSASEASNYQYVAQFVGSNTEDWTVVFWNKIGPNGQMDGWYGNSALTLSIAAGDTKYVAFDSNSQGGWAAAPGTGIPTDSYGGYSATWGEFDFGDTNNNNWSGWDVSAIQAQAANQPVQGMKICAANGSGCSYITTGAGEVVNAYTYSLRNENGIGGNQQSGAVRLQVIIDYN